MSEDCWEMVWCLPQLFHAHEATDKMPLKSHAVFVLSCTSNVELISLIVNLCNSFLSPTLSLQLSWVNNWQQLRIFLNISFPSTAGSATLSISNAASFLPCCISGLLGALLLKLIFPSWYPEHRTFLLPISIPFFITSFCKLLCLSLLSFSLQFKFLFLSLEVFHSGNVSASKSSFPSPPRPAVYTVFKPTG